MRIHQSCAHGRALWVLSVLGSSVSLTDENSPPRSAGTLLVCFVWGSFCGRARPQREHMKITVQVFELWRYVFLGHKIRTSQICWMGWTEIRSSANKSPSYLVGHFSHLQACSWSSSFWWLLVSTSLTQSPPSALLGNIGLSDASVACVCARCWEPASLPGSSSVCLATHDPFLLAGGPWTLLSPLPCRAAAGGPSIGSHPAGQPQVLKQNTPCPHHQLQTNNKPDAPRPPRVLIAGLSICLCACMLAVNILDMLLFKSQSSYFWGRKKEVSSATTLLTTWSKELGFFPPLSFISFKDFSE